MAQQVGLLVRLEARPGKETEVARFLAGALPLAEQELTTTEWFALRLGPSTFGIFDMFPDEDGRQAHLSGPIAGRLNGEGAGAVFSRARDRSGRRAGGQTPPIAYRQSR